MKKVLIILLIIGLFLSACSTNNENSSNVSENSKIANQTDLPKPGDEDFVGPLEKEDWEEHKDKFNK